MVLRMIEGACLNAGHAHPEHKMSRPFARSIAKRAAGTLTSQWRDVLAASQMQSDADGGEGPLRRPHAGSGLVLNRPRRHRRVGNDGMEAAGTIEAVPAVLRRIHREISPWVNAARGSGDEDYASALIDVLKVIGREIANAKAP